VVVPSATVQSLLQTSCRLRLDVLYCNDAGRTGRMGKGNWRQVPDHPVDQRISVGTVVRVYPGTAREVAGVIVEDFGDSAGQAVRIGGHRIVDAARRWAVRLNNGSLVFVDGEDISAG
jgi:hypothetical protein